MKSSVKFSTVLVLCLFSSCLGQTSTSELKPLVLQVGTSHTFEFFENGIYIGYNQYTVVKKEMYNEIEAYFVDSVVDLNSSSITLHMDASYILDTSGSILHYEFDAVIDGENYIMTAEVEEGSFHIVGSQPGKEYDKTIRLAKNTFSLDNNMICQWDLMFSSVVLKRGESFAALAVAVQPMKTTMVRASVSGETVSVQAAGKTWECLRLEFSVPKGYIMYVTEDGQLVRMENGGLVITLKE